MDSHSGTDTCVPVLDLAAFRDQELRVYAGRAYGETVRRDTGRDRLDDDPRVARVIIQVPEDTWDVSSGFWLGLFGPSVRRLRREGFLARYEFRGGFRPDDVEAGIEDALAEEDPFASG